jgi:hypothetical protein
MIGSLVETGCDVTRAVLAALAYVVPSLFVAATTAVTNVSTSLSVMRYEAVFAPLISVQSVGTFELADAAEVAVSHRYH